MTSLWKDDDVLFACRFVDWTGIKKGFLWAIGLWSVESIMHAGCGIITEWRVGASDKQALINETNVDVVSQIIMVSVMFFVFSRFVLAVGEAANFPAVIMFPKNILATVAGIGAVYSGKLSFIMYICSKIM